MSSRLSKGSPAPVVGVWVIGKREGEERSVSSACKVQLEGLRDEEPWEGRELLQLKSSFRGNGRCRLSSYVLTFEFPDVKWTGGACIKQSIDIETVCDASLGIKSLRNDENWNERILIISPSLNADKTSEAWLWLGGGCARENALLVCVLKLSHFRSIFLSFWAKPNVNALLHDLLPLNWLIKQVFSTFIIPLEALQTWLLFPVFSLFSWIFNLHKVFQIFNAYPFVFPLNSFGHFSELFSKLTK